MFKSTHKVVQPIEIKINGFSWYYRDKQIFEYPHSEFGIDIYSKHITSNEREQILKQIKSWET